MELTEKTRAIIVGVQLPDVSDEEHQSSLTELHRLATTLGLEVIGRLTQKRFYLSKAAVIGRGKLKELAHYTGGTGFVPSPATNKTELKESRNVDPDEDEDEEAEGGPNEPLPKDRRANVVLVDHDVSPSQAKNLEKAAGAKVYDRTAIILSIFQRHARTREAKLEVEIAHLAYMAPRLREMGGGGDRQRGGIAGGRGSGESSTEIDKRKVRDRIAELRRELEAIEKTAQNRRQRRSEQSTVALVGYTNAGKSSLMRGLTESEVYVADKLFATLDTTIRALRPETKPRILVSDTVGFIKKLPHGLVASFRATLDAASDSDLLLHVVDASDAAFQPQIEVTREALREIKAGEIPSLVVLNKIDRVEPLMRTALAARFPDAVMMSAKSPEDVAMLHRKIVDFFEAQMTDGEVLVPYAKGALVSEIHETCRVLKETHEDEGTRLLVRARPHIIEKLQNAAQTSQN
jgi:GTP-binding protein HflX